METLTLIISIIIFSVIFFLIGAAGMSKWIRSKNGDRSFIEKPPTRNSIYADHVINTAARIYCNFSKSKIIRLGETHPRPNNDRYGEALNEAFNLVNSAYAVFDKLDQDEKNNVVN